MSNPPLPSPSALVPLVGREREQDVLRTALDAALSGRGALVLIGGEAGIGKTALAEAALAEAAARGALALVGRAYDLAETPPYGPWRELFGCAPASDDLPTLPAAIAPPERAGEVLASQQAIIARAQAHLAALAVRRPLVLLLEDLHWADPASLDLLRVVARNLGDLPLLLIATYRDDELADNHPLAALLPALVREAHPARLDLAPLDTAAVAVLVAARYSLATAERGRLAKYLLRRTEGNALFLNELLRTLESAGALRRADNGWALGDLAAVPVPPLLRQVIAGRLARLGDEDRRLLAVASVIGQEPPFDLWAAVSEADGDALLATTERAVAARLLDSTDARVRFAHALIREALYEGTLAPRRQGWHQRTAEALLAKRSPDPDAVAYHLQRAGDSRAVEWLTQAGHRARRAFAPRIAAERYDLALKLLPNGGDPAQRGWLLLHLSMARYFDDPHAGIGYLSAAIQLANQADDHALAAYARFRRGFNLTGIGDYRRGLPEMAVGVAAIEALADDAQRRLADVGYEGRSALGKFAQRLALAGRCAEAQTLALRATARGDEAYAFFALAWVHSAFGRVAEALAFRERGCATLQVQGGWFELGIHTWCGLQRLLPYCADQLAERQRLAAAAEAAFGRSGGLAGEEATRLGYLPLLALEGGWTEARALALDVEASSRAYRQEVVSLLAELAHAQGDSALADQLIRKWIPAGPSEEPGHIFLHVGLGLQRLAATLAIEAGDCATARAWLEAHDRWLTWSGTVLGRAHGQLAWATYHRAVGDRETAREQAESALAHATEPRQPLALLAAHRLLGELDADAGRYANAQAHLDAALALAEACATPYERALTLLALAESRRTAGRVAAAQAALDEARALFERLGAAPALARTERVAAALTRGHPATRYPDGLTEREVTVLRLVASGQSNREVAATIAVSKRTVERHIENLYRKIAARNRAEATAYAIHHHLA